LHRARRAAPRSSSDASMYTPRGDVEVVRLLDGHQTDDSVVDMTP
jgi:hypothetical protein